MSDTYGVLQKYYMHRTPKSGVKLGLFLWEERSEITQILRRIFWPHIDERGGETQLMAVCLLAGLLLGN